MLITLLLSAMLMAGLFLLLYAGIGLIQDNRFFSSAPKEVLAVVKPKEERFPGAHALGYALGIGAILIMAGSFVIGAVSGIKEGYSFGQFFLRFLIMCWGLKAFDIIFFDWFLLCNKGLNFFCRFYPESGAVMNRGLFGYNWKTHLIHILASPVLAAVLALICTRFT